MKSWSLLIVAFVALMFTPFLVDAHCDTMNGPVINSARKALEAGNVNLVLIWVQPRDEAEIRAAFQKTMTVRRLSPAAEELADMYFFETLVRIHRAGEGVPYTGLKPAETEVEPGIVEADKAVETGSIDLLVESLSYAMQESVRDRFADLTARSSYSVDDVTAGREYVKAYVEFIHFVERLHQTVTSSTGEHSPQTIEGHDH